MLGTQAVQQQAANVVTFHVAEVHYICSSALACTMYLPVSGVYRGPCLDMGRLAEALRDSGALGE